MRRFSTFKRWYLIYSKPRQERIAQMHLERQGYETYLPMIRTPRRRLGKRIIRIEPMFPRYLFIRLDKVSDNWAPIRSTIGVANLVRFSVEPAPVPDDLITALKQRDDHLGIQDLPLNEFAPGQAVRIEEGPLVGYEGIYLAKTSGQRVMVLLDVVGKSTRTQIEVSRLGPTNL